MKKEVEGVRKQYTVFVPSDYDISLKVVPSEEFFKKKEEEQGPLVDFGLDDKTQLINNARFDAEREYAGRLDNLACRLPKDLLKAIAIEYMGVRGLKGKVTTDGEIIKITNSKGKILNLRLGHMLTIVCSAPSKENKEVLKQELNKSANYRKKVANTRKIDSVTRKGF